MRAAPLCYPHSCRGWQQQQHVQGGNRGSVEVWRQSSAAAAFQLLEDSPRRLHGDRFMPLGVQHVEKCCFVERFEISHTPPLRGTVFEERGLWCPESALISNCRRCWDVVSQITITGLNKSVWSKGSWVPRVRRRNRKRLLSSNWIVSLH